ncbi:MAG: pilin [Candidatus Gracilibacteria bacterium]|jgi:hypothetical protein
MKKYLFLIFTSIQLLTASAAVADALDFRSIIDDFQQNVSEESTQVEDGTAPTSSDEEPSGGISFPTFSEQGEGANVIVAAIQRFLDFFKLIITPVTILFIVIMGVRMVTAGKESEEVLSQSKNFISYGLQGLVIIFMSDSLVEVFFGADGGILRGGESGAQEFGRQASTLFRGIYSLIQILIGSIAVSVLIMAGMRFVGGSASEDQVGKAKKQITWALVGLFVIGISEFVVKEILFQNQGKSLGVEEAKLLFVQVTNFIAGTLGTLSFAFLLYAGYLYVLGVQNEDNVAKSKKIIMGAAVGIILALAAFAIVNTVVELDASR